MTPTAPDVPLDFDPASPEVRADPYPYYRYLRDHRPVAFLRSQNWYAVTCHEDVERVLRSPAEFSSAIMLGADRALLGRDPPAHSAVRRIANRIFDAGRMQALEHRIATIARQLVRPLVSDGRGDFVQQCAIELPVRIIAHLLGVEDDRLLDFKRWSAAIAAGPANIPPGRQVEVARQLRQFDRFFADLVATRQRQPGSDVVSALLYDAAGRDLLDPDDVCSLSKLLLIAGNETATNLAGNAMLALFATPGLQQCLRRDPRLCSAWVEETLRFDSPVQLLLRTATSAVEIKETLIPKGAVVAAFLGSANRDERRHRSPDTFELARAGSHLAFGTGPHYCLGAALARLEATIILRTLIEETRDLVFIESAAEVPQMPAIQLRGPQRLLIELR